jgi:hypothetical protein
MTMTSKTFREPLILQILVAVGLMLASCSSSAKELPFETVSGYPISDYEQSKPALVAVMDRAGLASLPRLMSDGLDVGKALRETDFSTWFLLVAFQGVQMSGGHRIEVLGIERSGERIEVKARFIRPESGATLGVTSPYHVVCVKKEDLGADKFTFVLIDDLSGEEVAKVAYDLR